MRMNIFICLFFIGMNLVLIGCDEDKDLETSLSKEDKSNTNQKIENFIGMKLMFIAPSEFDMGSSSNEEIHGYLEGPVHCVKLSMGFYMGVYEVTQAQYTAVMGNNPSHFKGDNQPVEMVSWNDAVAFCERLSQMEGKTYRLPTEAQWEYACRAGTKSRYSFSDDDSNIDIFCWHYKNSNNTTHEVGQKSPNPFGLYDMHGNVEEWCSDWFGFYMDETITDPTGFPTGKRRVVRGGSWIREPANCRSAWRKAKTPDFYAHNIGFRVILMPD